MYRYMDWQNFFLFKQNCIFTNKSIILHDNLFAFGTCTVDNVDIYYDTEIYKICI
jgi:hypothetical protein